MSGAAGKTDRQRRALRLMLDLTVIGWIGIGGFLANVQWLAWTGAIGFTGLAAWLVLTAETVAGRAEAVVSSRAEMATVHAEMRRTRQGGRRR